MKQILFCLSLLVALASCTKSSAPLDNSTILRSGNWKATAYTVKYQMYGVDTVYDIYKNMDTCRYDDYLTFDSSYKGAQYSATKKCGGELDVMNFDWALKDNQTTLVLNNAQYTIGYWKATPELQKGNEYVEAKITKINAKSFTITYQTTLMPPALPPYPYPVTLYFTHTFTKM